MTYFLDVLIGGRRVGELEGAERVVEMDIWSQIFAEKFRIIFKVCIFH